jgi:DNA helicase IV
MSPDEVFTIIGEQSHLDETLSAIDRHHAELENDLRGVDTVGQRKNLENRDRTYQDVRKRPFFSVILDRTSGIDSSVMTRIGDHAIHGKQSELLVASWTSPEGMQYAQLERKQNNEIYGAIVEIADQKVTAVIETNTAKAERRRLQILKPKTDTLNDIIELITPEQDDVVRLKHSGVLVISGGPGTGKTVVGLQRIAFGLISGMESLLQDRRVLVIGPSESYLSYIKDFFPRLGLEQIEMRNFRSLCLELIPTNFQKDFNNFRVEQDSIKITKNSINFCRVVQEAVWPIEVAVSIDAVVETGINSQQSRTINQDDIFAIIKKYKLKFLSGEISYIQSRESVSQEIQKQLFSPIKTTTSISGRNNSQRQEMLERWLFKIGLHSQAKRLKLKEMLETPQGGRYRRLMEGMLDEYYKEDVESAIDSVAIQQKLDFNLLRKWLDANNGRRKSKSGIVRPTQEELNVKKFDLGYITRNTINKLDSDEILSDLKEIVNILLPRQDLIGLARQICSGSNRELFIRILGDKVGASLASRLGDTVRRGLSRKYIWSDVDLTVVAELSLLLGGNDQYRFKHVMIDEAQDLTKLELQVVSKFSVASEVLLVGDLNQATKIGYLPSWAEISVEFGTKDLKVVGLNHNYRIPENIYDYARLYLDEEDRIQTPSCDIEGGDVEIMEVAARDIFDVLNKVLMVKVSSGERVAVIASEVNLGQFKELRQLENVTILTPEDSKGLEVDHTIVFKPGTWYRPTGRLRNLMYVVLTRATKSVTILDSNLGRSKIINIDS